MVSIRSTSVFHLHCLSSCLLRLPKLFAKRTGQWAEPPVEEWRQLFRLISKTQPSGSSGRRLKSLGLVFSSLPPKCALFLRRAAEKQPRQRHHILTWKNQSQERFITEKFPSLQEVPWSREMINLISLRSSKHLFPVGICLSLSASPLPPSALEGVCVGGGVDLVTLIIWWARCSRPLCQPPGRGSIKPCSIALYSRSTLGTT